MRRECAAALTKEDTSMAMNDRLLPGFGALLAAAGVAAQAYAAHAQGAELMRTAGLFLLIHGVAVIAITASARSAPRRLLDGGAIALAGGTALFAADLAARALYERSLFPFAAPIGGSAMILAWVALAGAFVSA